MKILKEKLYILQKWLALVFRKVGTFMNIRKILIEVCIIILILLFLLALGFSLSRYISSINNGVSSEIANPLLIAEGDTEINIKEINAEKEYTFSIKNYDNTKTNEVSLNYQLEIISDLDTLEYKLYDENMNEINLTNNKSEEIIMPIKEKTSHNYILKFKVKPNFKKEDIIGKVEILVNAYQSK